MSALRQPVYYSDRNGDLWKQTHRTRSGQSFVDLLVFQGVAQTESFGQNPAPQHEVHRRFRLTRVRPDSTSTDQ